MEKEFLGVARINLRLNEPEDNQPPGGELELRSKNNKKFPKYKSKFISITLERAPTRSDSRSDAASPRDPTRTYIVSGLPSDLIKSTETMKLKLTTRDGEVESAHLIICDADGKTCQSVKLEQLALPKESVDLKSEKRRSGLTRPLESSDRFRSGTQRS